MRLLIGILTDIHLTDSSNHPFTKRIDKIAAAIGSAEIDPASILLVFGGDLANKGMAQEYAMLSNAISRLQTLLGDRFPGVPVHFASVPGNHDLFHPVDSEDYRRNLVEGSLSTLRDDVPNAVYVFQLLEPQKPYQDFEDKLQGLNNAIPVSRLVSSSTINCGNHQIRLNLINTALVSQIHEKQGSIVLPIPALRNVLNEGDHSSLSITVMHHPLYWIESSTLMDLRDLLGRCSDYVLTGHQHFASGYQALDDLGRNIKYYESPAFYDQNSPTSSAFRVLVFDLDAGTEKQLLFRWKRDIYVPDAALETQADWQTLVRNRALRPTIAMDPAVLEGFNNPGFAYISKDRSSVGLVDLFVYPDLRESVSAGSTVHITRGKDVLSRLTMPGMTILQGPPLSGKTSLTKKIVLDVRAQNDAVPLWLDGAEMNCATPDDLEALVLEAFRKQYSKQQLNSYLQLLPSQRFIVIDNWHLAHLSVDGRPALYKWLEKFAGSSILLVDQVFEVKELIGSPLIQSSTPEQDKNIRKLMIGALNNVSKASLILRWMKTRKNSEYVNQEESKELQKVESLVSALLGKDSLPPYAFFILCVLQALESNKTAALAGGSFGPLFEILILSALEKTQSDDLQISLKLVFMQELGFHMWSKGATSISREEIEEVANRYMNRTLFDLPVERFLSDLKRAKIMASFDGNYTFMYPHYLYYSVARYMRDHFEDEKQAEIRSHIDGLVDTLSSVEHATIIMFLIYFEKDKDRLIDRLVGNAEMIYASVPAAKLDEEDSKNFSSIPTLIAPPKIEAEPDIAKNRHEVRASNDVRELATTNQNEQSPAIQGAYGYSDELTDTQKMHLAQQTIAALGQVIRNFSANLEGPRKLKVLGQTYLLGLRSLGRIMGIFGGVIEALPSVEGNPDSEESLAKQKIRLAQGLIALSQLYAVVVIQNVSNNIGVMEMERAYNAVLETLPKTNAVRLIAVNIQMCHFAVFPEQEIRKLHRDIRTNRFALTVLQWLVGTYLAMNKVDKRTQDSMAELFNLDSAALDAARL